MKDLIDNTAELDDDDEDEDGSIDEETGEPREKHRNRKHQELDDSSEEDEDDEDEEEYRKVRTQPPIDYEKVIRGNNKADRCLCCVDPRRLHK